MYYKIYDWMINDLKLKGNELLIFALIYSFAENNQAFYGSYKTIKDRTSIKTDATINNSLKKLVDGGFLEKRKLQNGVEYNIYKKYRTYYKKYSQSSIKNIDNNKNNNKSYKYIQSEQDYEMPTEEEIERAMS